MLLITAETAETTLCLHCPTVLHEDEDESCRDSNGNRVCATCYSDGTAYVEPLDYELDGSR
jgi:hypothetical protein